METIGAVVKLFGLFSKIANTENSDKTISSNIDDVASLITKVQIIGTYETTKLFLRNVQ